MNRLKELRKAKGHTLDKLAEIVGIGRVQLGRYERGESNPKPEMTEKIAKALGVSTAFLLGVDETEKLNTAEMRAMLSEYAQSFEPTAELGVSELRQKSSSDFKDAHTALLITHILDIANANHTNAFQISSLRNLISKLKEITNMVYKMTEDTDGYFPVNYQRSKDYRMAVGDITVAMHEYIDALWHDVEKDPYAEKPFSSGVNDTGIGGNLYLVNYHDEKALKNSGMLDD